MKVGKLSAEHLQAAVLSKLGKKRADVLVHASLGEDSTVIDFGDEVCIISTDPITGAIEGIGELAVHISCNDIAANGGHPVGVQVLLLLPETINEAQIELIMTDIDTTARKLGIEVLGGHTEITSKVKDVIVAVTAVGRAKRNQYVTSSGAQAYDSVIITKGVGIEGTLIIAKEFQDRIPGIVRDDILDLASQLSVVPEGLLAAQFGVSAMHDITEGGLLGAAIELASASELGIEIWESEVYIPALTERISSKLNLNPLALLGSGSMLITTDRGNDLIAHLRFHGIKAYIVGRIIPPTANFLVQKDGIKRPLPAFVQDELWNLYKNENGDHSDLESNH